MNNALLGAAICCLLAFFHQTLAGHGQQGYFQYANIPAKGQYEFGYHRGNPYHYTSRYEQGHNWRFRTKVRWGDKSGGYGEHYYDYNHVDKGHKGKGWSGGQAQQGYGHSGQAQGHGHGYGHGTQGSFSDTLPVVNHGAQTQR